jgi:hypothetical protein
MIVLGIFCVVVASGALILAGDAFVRSVDDLNPVPRVLAALALSGLCAIFIYLAALCLA